MYEFEGFISNVKYRTFLRAHLNEYKIETFDINAAKGWGVVDLGNQTLGFSKWVSPKRTRSYPYARIYNTYHLPKRVTVIPVIKDEGLRGDNDRINFITLSMMNLLNVFIVLAWYDDAKANPRKEGKITSQRFNVQYVNERLIEIGDYQQTALHWNLMHFKRDFERVFLNAVESYERISQKTGIKMHPVSRNLSLLEEFKVAGEFDSTAFKEISLAGSESAARREILTTHIHELLSEGSKAYFLLRNYVGGMYHLTADEVIVGDEKIVLQESKNTSRHRLPSMNDVKDGLLKLILYSNIDELRLNGEGKAFSVRLKLTGNIVGSLFLPNDTTVIDAFCTENSLRTRERYLLARLNEEAEFNQFQIVIAGNQP
ncbi:MAG TPA: hypothetical protein VK003_20335 [Oceanobacillus sp.]|nr:hypothetical protein [Oceanobacillus sp.]